MEIEYQPWQPQPKQERFLSLHKAFEAMFGGAKGPGKTDALLAESTRQIDNPNYKGIIFRRTYPKLQELIERSKKWFTGRANWNGDIKRWVWPNGASVRFAHCFKEGDKYNYQGHEYHFIGFDQIEEFTETQYLFLQGCCRSADSSLRCYVRATANPGNVGHAWVKRRFIDVCPPDGTIKYFKRVNDEDIECSPKDPKALSRAYLFANVYDNPILLKNDPMYLRILEGLPAKDRKALLEGDWDIFAGQFFDTWRKAIHIIPYLTFKELIKDLPVTKFMALDYGYAKPASVGWYACLPLGKIIRYRELYVEGYTYYDLAHLILAANEKAQEKKIVYLVADPAIWGDKKHHEKHLEVKSGEAKGQSGYQVMQEVFGETLIIKKGDNRRIVGWGRFREYLKAYLDQFKQITTRFLVTDNCRNFIRTIPGCVHDETIPEDLDTNGEDHNADEGRYAFMSRPEIPSIPIPQPTTSKQFWDRVKRDVARSMPYQEEQEHPVSTEGARSI